MKNFLILGLVALVVYLWYGKHSPEAVTPAPASDPAQAEPPAAVPGTITIKDGLIYQDGKLVGATFINQYRVPKTILSNIIANGS